MDRLSPLGALGCNRKSPAVRELKDQLHTLKVDLQFLDFTDAVEMATQRAREVLNDQRETVRRALLHQHGEFLAATRQYEAVGGAKNLVNNLTRNSETHNYNVQLQVRQL